MNNLAIIEQRKIIQSFITSSDNNANTYEIRAAQRKESLVSDFELGYALQTAEGIKWQRMNQILLNAFSQHRTKESHEPVNCSMTSYDRGNR